MMNVVAKAETLRALELATHQLRKLRAQRDAARASAAREVDARVRVEGDALRDRAELNLVREEIARLGRAKRELEREIRRLKTELAAAQQAPTASSQIPQASPQPAPAPDPPEDSTVVRFSLLEPHDDDS